MGFIQSVKSKFYQFYTRKHGLIHKPKYEAMPISEIDYQNIQNGKLLASREQLMELLPKGGIVAELGVDYGDFSRKILDINQPSKLHLVDVWQSERYPEKLFYEVSSNFKSEINDGNVVINRGFSTEVVNQFPDEYFDWIYIDTVHDYKITKSELELYRHKVKKGGIIAGHDFIIGEIDVPWKYGVIEAVYDFCNTYGWEIIYVTMEIGIFPSFAIREK